MIFTVDASKVQSGQLITKEVQKLIDECNLTGGGDVIFPKGEYVLSTVFLKSNVNIVLEEGALLLGSLNFDDYCFDEPVDYPLYQDASHSFFHCSMFVGENVENIAITGKGKIDMRSVWDDDNKRDMHHRGPKSIALKYCNNVFIRDIGVYNTTDLAIYFAGCENVEIDGVKMRVYIDGISPDNSKNVIIRNCDVESGDDGIVFKSSYTLNKMDVCKNILVENCKVKSRCSALKFGTETNGGFEDICIKNVKVRETRLAGIAIESVDGAVLNNIYIGDIDMVNVASPLFIFLGERMRAPEGTPIGEINNVTIENVKATGPYIPYEAIAYKIYHDEDGKEQTLNYAGIMVKFTNTIARGVMAEITKTEPERKLYFEMFAYHLSEAPPTITLENGEQVPMCDEVICDDNVYVQFTPMANYQGAGVPFTHEKNANMYGFLQGWDVCSSNISTWTYATNWNNYLINYPDFDSITADLKIFSEMGVNRVYHQNQIHRRMPQMVEMRIFIESELMWNLSLSYDELAAEFIENYYGDAAPHIQQMYTTMTSYWAYLKDELDWIGGVYKNYRVKSKWPFQYVDAIRKMFVKAFDAIEPLKETDAAAYEKYYWRVCNAYLENLFMQMEFYGAEYGETYAQEAIDLFQAIIQRFDYNYMGDGSSNPLTNYIKKWRAAYV